MKAPLSRQIGATTTLTLKVGGMDCPNEVQAINRALGRLPVVEDVEVNLVNQEVTIRYSGTLSEDTLQQTVRSAGLRILKSEEVSPGPASKLKQIIVVSSSGTFTALGLILDWSGVVIPLITTFCFILATVFGGTLIFPKALRSLRTLNLDMNVLMTIAVLGAGAIGEWSEGAAVTFLFALSELLETFSLNRARRAVQALLKLSPETAFKKLDGKLVEVSTKEVQPNDLIIVKSGMRIPLDGIVEHGSSAVDQAPITGESIPVEKSSGDQVFAGTINGEGSLEIRVTKEATDTTLARIVKLVTEAQSQKAPAQQFVDKFARVYTPAVLFLSLALLIIPPVFFSGAWETWIYRSLVLLVIACPCALVISTPVSIVSGLTAMARRGVLIKGGIHLEEIGKLRALALDKTGTITTGKPRVCEVLPWDGRSEAEVIRVAAAIDVNSEHPLAKAVVAYANDREVTFERAGNYQSRSGRGAVAEIEKHVYFVGNHRFAHESAICSDELEKKISELESQAMSVVVVGRMPQENFEGAVLGILAISDSVRKNAAEAVQSLHSVGVRKIVMLSGDNQRTVDAISRQVKIDQAIGDLLPEQKIEHVKSLLREFTSVGMVGDGVNDAPAMAAASIGIAMGAAGTDTAIETADIALMNDDLSKVAEAVALGRRTLRVIQANIFFALATKAVFLVLALFGLTSLWLAILADTGATLLVIANALRLIRNPETVKEN